MFKKYFSNNWLASNSEESDKKEKKNQVWFWIKKLLRIGYFIFKILEFFEKDTPD